MSPYEVYDLETYRNQFLYCCMDLLDQKIQIFEVSNEIDDRELIFDHLKLITHQIGYNNKEFDYPVIDYILQNKSKLLLVKPEDFAWMIHERANEIIQNNEFFRGRPKIKQLDLYKLNHFDRFKISLKYCGFGLRMPVLQDLPVSHDALLTSDQMATMRTYNINDVETTYALYLKSKPLIEMRNRSTQDLGIDCSSMSNTAVARNTFIQKYCQLSGMNKYELKDLSTHHTVLRLRDVIDKKVSFKTPKYQKLLEDLMKDETNIVYDKFEYKFTCNTIVCDIKKGGLHSLHNPGYFTNKEMYLDDEDFSSYYPYLILSLGICPAHLDPVYFLKLMKEIVEAKMNYQKAGDKIGTMNAKISANSVFGLLSSDGSPIKDLKCLYQTTINGELFLLMLCEQLEMIEGVQLKYQNTDGVMIQYGEKAKDQAKKVIEDFAIFINIPLESVPMKAIYLESVSSYIAIKENGEVKRKGSFAKIGDKTLKDDSSANIVAIALEEYFVNGTPVKQTVENHNDIFDFYIGVKKFDNQTYMNSQLIMGDNYETLYHDKVLRFYVTTSSSVITKLYDSGKKESVIKGYNTQVAQVHEDIPMKDYKINYKYYINQANKIIDKIFLCDSEINFE
jgi:DNA polymerase elongation subunit (family B)